MASEDREEEGTDVISAVLDEQVDPEQVDAGGDDSGEGDSGEGDSGEDDEGSTPLVYRVLPFLAAIGAALFIYDALRGTWINAPQMAPHVGTSPEMMRLLIVLMVPISPTTWMILAMLYLGLRMNRDVLPS